MIIVGPGLDTGDDERTSSAAELCRCNAGLHTKLVNRFRWWEKDDGIHECFVVVDAVENEVVVLGAQAVHCERRAARLAEAKSLGIVICPGGRSRRITTCDPGRQQGNLCEIAAVQRQFGGLASFDNLSDGRICRIHHWGSCFYGDRLGYLADV